MHKLQHIVISHDASNVVPAGSPIGIRARLGVPPDAGAHEPRTTIAQSSSCGDPHIETKLAGTASVHGPT